MTDIPHIVADLKRAIERARKEGVSLGAEAQGAVTDFKAKQREQLKNAVLMGIAAVAKSGNQDAKTAQLITQLRVTHDLTTLDALADKLLELATDEDAPQGFSIKKPKVPSEIKDDLHADIDEVQRCMDSQCYRSAVILCGRILETALHRKYYEVTKNDLLEKSPGIGLGNLIAKLAEHQVALDPGLGNQIHLINQVRVHSVHQKQDAFRPSKAQAQAIVLYTVDVIEKLFA